MKCLAKQETELVKQHVQSPGRRLLPASRTMQEIRSSARFTRAEERNLTFTVSLQALVKI